MSGQMLKEFIRELDGLLKWLHTNWPDCVATREAYNDMEILYENLELSIEAAKEWNRIVGPYQWAIDQGYLEQLKYINHGVVSTLAIVEKYNSRQMNPTLKSEVILKFQRMNKLAREFVEAYNQ